MSAYHCSALMMQHFFHQHLVTDVPCPLCATQPAPTPFRVVPHVPGARQADTLLEELRREIHG